MRRRLIWTGAAAAALITLPLGWYYGSPWWTLWRMREAARAGDMRTLAWYIDLETMNRGAAARYRAYFGREIEKIRTDTETGRRFVANLRRRIASARAEAPVRPQHLREWLAGIPIRFGTAMAGAAGARRYEPYVLHHGLDRFEVRDRDAGWETGPLLTFHRHGIAWKLVGVRWGQQ